MFCVLFITQIVSHVTSVLLGSNLSDHHPVAFTLNVDCSLRYSALSIAGPLSAFFTAVLRHGYMPKCIRDCMSVPIPKNNKDPSSSKKLQSNCNCIPLE